MSSNDKVAPVGGPAWTKREDEDIRPILEHAGEIWSWLRTAVRRRAFMIVAVFSFIACGSAAAALFIPGSYTSRGRILAQSNIHLPVLANPNRAIPHAADTPARGVAPMVLSERNLERLIDETDLIDRWEIQRSPLLRLKDQAMELVLGPLSEDEKRDALVELLKRKVIVFTEDDVVNFQVTWYDPDTPVLLVQHLQDILLEERRARETGVISDALDILQQHGRELQEDIDRKLEDLRTMREELDSGRPRRAPRRRAVRAPAPRSSPSRADQAAIADLRADLDHARRTYREIESQRQHRLVDVQSTLRQRSVDLGPMHPDILALERRVEALSQPSAEEENLRRRMERLQAEYLRKGGRTEELQDTSPRAVARQRLAHVFDELEEGEDEEDEAVAYARAQVALSISKYEDILERISGARIELDTANAAFKYRYDVVGEPRRPREPDGLPPLLFIVGGLFLGVTAGLFAGLGRELAAARILGSWQLPRHVGLPVLGEVEVRGR
ncbi:MAG: hypothetical protein ACOC0J_01565 [Myxococcota bacterium]